MKLSSTLNNFMIRSIPTKSGDSPNPLSIMRRHRVLTVILLIFLLVPIMSFLGSMTSFSATTSYSNIQPGNTSYDMGTSFTISFSYNNGPSGCNQYLYYRTGSSWQYDVWSGCGSGSRSKNFNIATPSTLYYYVKIKACDLVMNPDFTFSCNDQISQSSTNTIQILDTTVAPTIQSTTYSTPVYSGGSVEMEALITDADGDLSSSGVKFQYAVSGQSTIDPSYLNEYNWHSNPSTGSYKFTIPGTSVTYFDYIHYRWKATDNTGKTSYSSLNSIFVNEDNAAPSIYSYNLPNIGSRSSSSLTVTIRDYSDKKLNTNDNGAAYITKKLNGNNVGTDYLNHISTTTGSTYFEYEYSGQVNDQGGSPGDRIDLVLYACDPDDNCDTQAITKYVIDEENPTDAGAPTLQNYPMTNAEEAVWHVELNDVGDGINWARLWVYTKSPTDNDFGTAIQEGYLTLISGTNNSGIWEGSHPTTHGDEVKVYVEYSDNLNPAQTTTISTTYTVIDGVAPVIEYDTSDLVWTMPDASFNILVNSVIEDVDSGLTVDIEYQWMNTNGTYSGQTIFTIPLNKYLDDDFILPYDNDNWIGAFGDNIPSDRDFRYRIVAIDAAGNIGYSPDLGYFDSHRPDVEAPTGSIDSTSDTNGIIVVGDAYSINVTANDIGSGVQSVILHYCTAELIVSCDSEDEFSQVSFSYNSAANQYEATISGSELSNWQEKLYYYVTVNDASWRTYIDGKKYNDPFILTIDDTIAPSFSNYFYPSVILATYNPTFGVSINDNVNGNGIGSGLDQSSIKFRWRLETSSTWNIINNVNFNINTGRWEVSFAISGNDAGIMITQFYASDNEGNALWDVGMPVVPVNEYIAPTVDTLTINQVENPTEVKTHTDLELSVFVTDDTGVDTAKWSLSKSGAYEAKNGIYSDFDSYTIINETMKTFEMNLGPYDHTDLFDTIWLAIKTIDVNGANKTIVYSFFIVDGYAPQINLTPPNTEGGREIVFTFTDDVNSADVDESSILIWLKLSHEASSEYILVGSENIDNSHNYTGGAQSVIYHLYNIPDKYYGWGITFDIKVFVQDSNNNANTGYFTAVEINDNTAPTLSNTYIHDIVSNTSKFRSGQDFYFYFNILDSFSGIDIPSLLDGSLIVEAHSYAYDGALPDSDISSICEVSTIDGNPLKNANQGPYVVIDGSGGENDVYYDLPCYAANPAWGGYNRISATNIGYDSSLGLFYAYYDVSSVSGSGRTPSNPFTWGVNSVLRFFIQFKDNAENVVTLSDYTDGVGSTFEAVDNIVPGALIKNPYLDNTNNPRDITNTEYHSLYMVIGSITETSPITAKIKYRILNPYSATDSNPYGVWSTLMYHDIPQPTNPYFYTYTFSELGIYEHGSRIEVTLETRDSVGNIGISVANYTVTVDGIKPILDAQDQESYSDTSTFTSITFRAEDNSTGMDRYLIDFHDDELPDFNGTFVESDFIPYENYNNWGLWTINYIAPVVLQYGTLVDYTITVWDEFGNNRSFIDSVEVLDGLAPEIVYVNSKYSATSSVNSHLEILISDNHELLGGKGIDSEHWVYYTTNTTVAADPNHSDWILTAANESQVINSGMDLLLDVQIQPYPIGTEVFLKIIAHDTADDNPGDDSNVMTSIISYVIKDDISPQIVLNNLQIGDEVQSTDFDITINDFDSGLQAVFLTYQINNGEYLTAFNSSYPSEVYEDTLVISIPALPAQSFVEYNLTILDRSGNSVSLLGSYTVASSSNLSPTNIHDDVFNYDISIHENSQIKDYYNKSMHESQLSNPNLSQVFTGWFSILSLIGIYILFKLLVVSLSVLVIYHSIRLVLRAINFNSGGIF